MKTIKNKATGKIERVKDKEAEPKVKYGWVYTSKSEWKNYINDEFSTKKKGKTTS